MSKYYTPEIEEFFTLGLDYECYELNEWKKFKVGLNMLGVDFRPLRRMIDDGEIRVKYLCREDIESFGFEHTDGNDSFAFFKSGKWTMQFNIGHCYIHTGNEMLRHFAGYIKNKSELKRILKQICYDKGE